MQATEGREGKGHHNTTPNKPPTNTSHQPRGGVACTEIGLRCNRRRDSYRASLRDQNYETPRVTAKLRVPYTQHHWQGQGGQGQCEETATPTTQPTPKQAQNNPTQTGNPATLYCSLKPKRGGQSKMKNAVQTWQHGRHAGKGTRRGPNPTNKNHTTRKHTSPPAHQPGSAQACQPIWRK